MGSPITIKRTKISVKSRSAKPGVPFDPVENEDGGDEGEEDVPEDVPVFVSKPVPTVVRVGGGSLTAMTVAAVLALIATMLFLFVLLIQWTEYRELQFLFPRPLPLGSMMAMLPW